MSKIQHGKQITIESYYDGQLTATKHEYEMSVFSSKDAILKDVIEALAVISSGQSHKLSLEICIDSKGRHRLIKKWIAQ